MLVKKLNDLPARVQHSLLRRARRIYWPCATTGPNETHVVRAAAREVCDLHSLSCSESSPRLLLVEGAHRTVRMPTINLLNKKCFIPKKNNHSFLLKNSLIKFISPHKVAFLYFLILSHAKNPTRVKSATKHVVFVRLRESGKC